MTRVVGVLLAAGARALVSDERGSWLLRACGTLRNGGCDDVVVVIGAEAPKARAMLGDLPVFIVEATEWSDGMSAPLRAGLDAAAEADAALVHLVDLPGVGPAAVAQVIQGASRDVLARAVHDGQPGYPVLIGRDHWNGIMQVADVHGYLNSHDDVLEIAVVT